MTILFLAIGGLHFVGIIVLLLVCCKATKGHEDDAGFHLDL